MKLTKEQKQKLKELDERYGNLTVWIQHTLPLNMDNKMAIMRLRESYLWAWHGIHCPEPIPGDMAASVEDLSALADRVAAMEGKP